METWNKSKPYIIAAYSSVIVIKELWELGSDEPLATGVFDLVTFLSKYWLLVISMLMFFLIALPPILDRLRGLQKVFNKHFKNETVPIDGKHFIDCTFVNCTLRYNGGKYTFDKGQQAGVDIYSENEAVVGTIQLLQELELLNPNLAKNIRRVPKGYK